MAHPNSLFKGKIIADREANIDVPKFSDESTKSIQIHPVKSFLLGLFSKTPSPGITTLLQGFNEPRPITEANFITGVKKFIELANLNPSDGSRERLYGNRFLGFHYLADLVELCKQEHSLTELNSNVIANISPKAWDITHQDGFITLIYRGRTPAEALDKLAQGPTLIDCGMFVQLSMWFGIRYMLGNDRFNEYFDRNPFFITQLNYEGIKSTSKPYSGNPLFTFLEAIKDGSEQPISFTFVPNHKNYHLKHPGGNYGGDNCVVVKGEYAIFNPLLDSVSGLTRDEVIAILRNAYNLPHMPYDNERLAYMREHLDGVNERLGLTHAVQVSLAESLANSTITSDEIIESPSAECPAMNFSLTKFIRWMASFETSRVYRHSSFLPISNPQPPRWFLNILPFENRGTMSFETFCASTKQQQELKQIALDFCAHIDSGKSKLVILSGQAGIGKTASAVCAAKELLASNKKVVWISEVTVKGWATGAKSMEDLDKCSHQIDEMLADNPDAVFLDDDNLGGYSGQILLEKIYAWYVSHPNKGLYVSSNSAVTFENCYGLKLDQTYHYPPYCEYDSPQYLQQVHIEGLTGLSLRQRREGQSIGAIVSVEAYEMNASKSSDWEVIPYIDDLTQLVPIRQSLASTGKTGPDYNALSELQKKWTIVHMVLGMRHFKGFGQSEYIRQHRSINTKTFEHTDNKTIVVELGETNYFQVKQIASSSMSYLISVLNFAHDKGGLRIILVNKTSFSNDELYQQVIAQLPEHEKERTKSRFQLLLCEDKASIFTTEGFEGKTRQVDRLPQGNDLFGLLTSRAKRHMGSDQNFTLPTKHPNFYP